jgi:hypothetical protein
MPRFLFGLNARTERLDRIRIQFTLRGLLVATFWAALCVLCATLLRDADWRAAKWWVYLVGYTGIVSLPTAIGALFGRPARGMIVGLLIVIVMILKRPPTF